MASDYLLKLEGIKGESLDAKHKDEIEIESFSWGATQPAGVASGGGGAGKGELPGYPLHDASERGVSESNGGVRQRSAHQRGDADRT